MRKWKVRLLIPVILFACILFFLFYSFPTAIDLDYPAIEYRNDQTGQAQEARIWIKGTWKRPLFRNGSFHGSIMIDKYEFTRAFQLLDVPLTQWDNTVMGVLTYEPVQEGLTYGPLRNLLTLRTLGPLWIWGDFERLEIHHARGENGPLPYILSAPARTYEEALLNKQMME